jgi:hypothetical protein
VSRGDVSAVATSFRGVIRLAPGARWRRYDAPVGPPRAACFHLSGLPMRWLLLVLTVFAFVLCFTRHGAGAWGFWMLVGLIGIFATTLAFVQARIAGSARDDSLSEYDLKRLREGKDPLKHERPGR